MAFYFFGPLLTHNGHCFSQLCINVWSEMPECQRQEVDGCVRTNAFVTFHKGDWVQLAEMLISFLI